MDLNRDVQEKVREIGGRICSLIGEEVPSFYQRKRWMGKLMEWAMKDEVFKVRLFRFVDVLPCLKSDRQVVELLHEYLGDLDEAPRIVKSALRGISRTGIRPHIAARVIRAGVQSLAAEFIAAPEPEEALSTLWELRREGVAFTVDILGEEVLSDAEASEYSGRYERLLQTLGREVSAWPGSAILDYDDRGPIPRVDVSLKVSSFYSQLDPMDWDGSLLHTKEGLRPVIETAKRLRASVTIDMEHYYVKDFTLALFKTLLEEHTELEFAGVVIQAYLEDSKRDVIDLIAWAQRQGRRVTIRLVKGAYWDYETAVNRQKGWPVPVFLNKEQTDANFEDLTRLLLENTQTIRPALGTHNIRSISYAAAVADALNVRKEAFELQCIYGMAEPIRRSLARMGYRTRVYVPVGELIPGMGYLIRRLLENSSNESFLRKSFLESVPFDELIRPPQPEPKPVPEPEPLDQFRNEPTTDFSKVESRRRMTDALKEVRAGFARSHALSIGGRDVRTDATIASVNPAKPGEVVGIVSSAAAGEAERAVQEARRAWEDWRRTRPEDRAACLTRAAEAMRQRRFELTALEVFEVGKSWPEADGDVAEAIDFLEYYAREMLRLGRPRILGRYPGEENVYEYVPRGVGAVISPWNFPLAIPTGMVSAALVTGNCVLMKPSSLSPVLGRRLAEIFMSAGLPHGVLNFLPGSGEAVGEFLVSHPSVDFIAFTGSKDVGLRIVERAANTVPGQRNIKRVIAEMGGKNAIIVDETADLDEAIKGVVQSALGFQGQKCSACSRVIVVGEIFDELTSRLRHAVESVRIGPPEEPGNFMGPVVDAAARTRILDYVEAGAREGSLLLAKEVSGEGFFTGAAIIADAPRDSKIAQEEVFGPVLALFRATTIDDALRIANDTPYALTGGIFSRNPAVIRKARQEFLVGNLYINRKITGALVGRQPFGGFGMSGVGSKAGGPDYLLQFLHVVSISENTLRRGFAPGHATGAAVD